MAWPSHAEITARQDSLSALVLAVNNISAELENAYEEYSDDENFDHIEEEADQEYLEQWFAQPLADASMDQGEENQGQQVVPIQDVQPATGQKRRIQFNKQTKKFEMHGPPAIQCVHPSPKKWKQTTLTAAEGADRSKEASDQQETESGAADADAVVDRDDKQEPVHGDAEAEPAADQGNVAEVVPPRKRGRKSPFKDAELTFIKKWIDTNCVDLMEFGAPSQTVLKDIMHEVAWQKKYGSGDGRGMSEK